MRQKRSNPSNTFPLDKGTTLKFLLDENVDIRVASFLQEKGTQVTIVPKGLVNGKVLALAKATRSILLTNDSDFANQRMYPPEKFAGIVIFRIHPPLIRKLTSALRVLLTKVEPSAFEGKLFILTEHGFLKNTHA